MNLHRIFPIILLLIATNSFGQTNGCDTIYNNLEVLPQYKNGNNALSDYLSTELIPIIGGCLRRDSSFITSLYIILTIDNNGKVIDAIFPKNNLSFICKDDLKRKLLTMEGWKAGQKDNQSVCSQFVWPISCLKWE